MRALCHGSQLSHHQPLSDQTVICTCLFSPPTDVGEVSVEGRAFGIFSSQWGKGGCLEETSCRWHKCRAAETEQKEKKKNCWEYWNLMSLSEHFCPSLFSPSSLVIRCHLLLYSSLFSPNIWPCNFFLCYILDYHILTCRHTGRWHTSAAAPGTHTHRERKPLIHSPDMK